MEAGQWGEVAVRMGTQSWKQREVWKLEHTTEKEGQGGETKYDKN